MLRKRAREARREFDAGRVALPMGKAVQRLVATKLWVNGQASEDRYEWTEEDRAHCERCSDDKMETPEVQTERFFYQKNRGDRLIALQGRTYKNHSRQGSPRRRASDE